METNMINSEQDSGMWILVAGEWRSLSATDAARLREALVLRDLMVVTANREDVLAADVLATLISTVLDVQVEGWRTSAGVWLLDNVDTAKVTPARRKVGGAAAKRVVTPQAPANPDVQPAPSMPEIIKVGGGR